MISFSNAACNAAKHTCRRMILAQSSADNPSDWWDRCFSLLSIIADCSFGRSCGLISLGVSQRCWTLHVSSHQRGHFPTPVDAIQPRPRQILSAGVPHVSDSDLTQKRLPPSLYGPWLRGTTCAECCLSESFTLFCASFNAESRLIVWFRTLKTTAVKTVSPKRAI